MNAVRKKVVAYLRVSSSEQNTDNQIPAIMQWGKSRGYQLIELYEEHESVWKSGHQKELSRLFADLPKRKVDICLVWSLDRLTREGVAAILNLVGRFKRYGVRVPATFSGMPARSCERSMANKGDQITANLFYLQNECRISTQTIDRLFSFSKAKGIDII